MGKHPLAIIRMMGRAALGIGLFAWLVGSAAPARGSPSIGLSLDTHILNPPNAITDLTASPVGINPGDLQLAWTAPSNKNRVPMDHYLVRYATYPAPSQALANVWWNTLASSEQTISPAHAPGTQEFAGLSGLTINVTYYFGIKTIDQDGQLSPIDALTGTANQAQSQPVGSSSAPPTPTNFGAIALSTISVQWTWDITPLATYYLLSTYPADTPVGTTTALTYIESGFTPNVAVSRILRAGNASGLSSPTSAVTIYTVAQTPVNLSTTSVNLNDVTLAWGANNNPSGTRFQLERSNNGVAYSPIATVATTTYQDTGLSGLTTYYYRVRALNGDALMTGPSNVVVVFTQAPPDSLAPLAPAGLKGFLDATGKVFTVSWEPVLYNVDGSSITDLAGYYVYRRNTLNGGAVRLTPAPLTAAAFADQVNNTIYYYTIRAVDTSGNESQDSLFADSSVDENIIYLSSDGVTQVRMPESVNDLLRSAYNKYGVPLTIQMDELPLANDNAMVRNIRLRLVRVDNGQTLTDIAFTKPQALVEVGYNLVGGNVAPGSPLGGSGGVAGNISPDQLALYWFNGVTWIRIGGTLNQSIQAVTTKSSFLGNYQLRASANPSTLTLTPANVYPRLFTPNGDGLNDRVYFILENPNNAAVSGEIIDKDGRHVRTLPPPDANAGIGTTLIWDGKDDRGNVVPGDVYIYKISGENRTFTGTVGVAR